MTPFLYMLLRFAVWGVLFYLYYRWGKQVGRDGERKKLRAYTTLAAPIFIALRDPQNTSVVARFTRTAPDEWDGTLHTIRDPKEPTT